MNGNAHERAIDLITRRDVEAISEGDGVWLESHLSSCADCASFEMALTGAAQALRTAPVMASASLLEKTRSRVHARALQLREQRARTVLIAVSFCLGVMTSTVTAWIWWKSGAWVAERLGLPSGIVEPGVLLFWLLPAIAIAVLLVVSPPSALEGSLMQRLLNDRARGMQ